MLVGDFGNWVFVWWLFIKSWLFGLVCEKDVVSWFVVRVSIFYREYCGININI